MKPRQGPYETYWKFAAERQRIFFARRQGATPPYTEDPILNAYKFCNAYRASDRVSQFLIRDVIYGAPAISPEDTIFRIFLFRLLNRPATWTELEKSLGTIRLANFTPGAYAHALEAMKEAGPIYGNAFILCATKAFGFDEKHRNHLALLEHVFSGQVAARLLASRSLKELFERLRELPLIGDFMAYQIAIDFNYSEAFNFDENDFTAAGPGALRGIAKCFEDIGEYAPADVIRWMVDHQEKEFKRLGLNFLDLFGRPLHAIDCQGLLCETDKYSRVAFPELASNRVRIKATFAPNPRPVEYFYPPKWNLAQ